MSAASSPGWRRSLAVAVGIALATVQGALVAIILSGRLPLLLEADAASIGDAPWFGVWFAYAVAGAIVLERVPGSVVGWLLCVVGSIPGYALLLELVMSPGRLPSALHLVIPPLLLVALPAAFPDGVGRSRVRRLAWWVAVGLAATGVVTAWLPEGVGSAVAAVVLVASGAGGLILLAGQIRTLRVAAQPRRAQHSIFLGGFGAAVGVMVLGAVVGLLPGTNPGGEWVQLVGLTCLPIGVAIAMLGTGLWGTDLARGRGWCTSVSSACWSLCWIGAPGHGGGSGPDSVARSRRRGRRFRGPAGRCPLAVATARAAPLWTGSGRGRDR